MLKKEMLNQRLLNDLRAALEEGQFRVYYQPKYDIRCEPPRLLSGEALIRWKHPELGMISPAAFIKELYTDIGGDYDQAVRVLRIEKLIDKHIRKLTKNGVVDRLIEAGKKMEPTELFEAAHAMKGVCANLGLAKLSEMASEIAEEYRPGNPRKLSDTEVTERIAKIEESYKKTADGIRRYEEG